MSFTYGAGSNPTIDAPRFLVADTQDSGHIFEDEEITMAYSIDKAFVFFPGSPSNGYFPASYGTPSYRRVAACLLDALASNKARVAGMIKALDIQADLGKVAAALKEQANNYRTVDDESATCAFIEVVQDVFTWRQRVLSQWLRQFAV